MVFPEGILSIPLEPFLRLKDWWDEREKNKGIKEQLLITLDTQIKTYNESFEELNRIGKEELIPLIDSINVVLTESQSNRFLIVYAKIINSYSRIVDSLVSLSKGCKLISLNPAFMKDLGDASAFLYDFVVRMGDMVKDNDVVVMDDRFYTFLKLYEKEFTRDLKREDVEKSVELLRPYVTKVKNVIAPSIAKRKFRKKTSRKIMGSFKALRITTKRINIRPPTIQPENYVPSKLQPITIILEEVSKIQP